MFEERSAVITTRKNKIISIITILLILVIAFLEALFLSTVLNGKIDETISVFAPIKIEKQELKFDTLYNMKKLNSYNMPKAEVFEEPKKEEVEKPVVTKPMIAITYDDGPHPQNTLKILDILNKYNAKATFFMLGENVKRNSWIPRKVAEQGSQIGTHSWNHPNLNKLDKKDISFQIDNSSKIIEENSGQVVKLFRPPYGNANQMVRDIAKEKNKAIILWNIDTEDWKSKDAKKVTEHVLNNVKEGDIVLMHDIYSSTVEASEEIIKVLTERGYELVTVSELFENKGKNLEFGEKYYSFK